MSTIVTRSGKGTALTHTEVDANFTNLNADKAEASAVILATEKGAASGVCPLDAASKVASTYLPSYVDDVLEYANYAGLPVTGETGKIYVALDTNKTYRWSGSAYIYITSGAVDSVAGKTGVVTLTASDVGLGNVTNNAAVANLSGTNTGDQTLPTTLPASDVYAWAKEATKPTYTATEVSLGNASNTSDANKPISTATQTALDLKSPLASPTFTGTVSGITKAMVSLGNVDNTSDTNKPVSTATQTALDLKAPLASPTFTGTVSGITATMVGLGSLTNNAAVANLSGTNTGDQILPTTLPASDVSAWAKEATKPTYTASEVGLGNVDNTTDLLKPISTATQTALDFKSPLNSPTFTGTPSVPTATAGTNTTQIASTAYVRSEVSALVASAPTALDTLNELATALGNDANFSTTVTTALGLKAPLASPTFTGTVTSPTFVGSLTGTSTGLSVTLAVAYGGTGVTTSSGTGNNVLSTSPTLVTPVLGTPTSGTLTNCTFPTLNQNTTGTASNITAYTVNQNVGTANTVQHSDITTARAASLTTGYVYYGNTGTKYAGFDGTNFVTSMPMNFNILGSSASCTGNAATVTTVTAANLAGAVAPSTTGNVLTSNGTSWISSPVASGGGLLRITRYTTAGSGTWTKPSDTVSILIKTIAGGGGGGGTGTGGQVAGSGGGAGGYAEKYIASASSSYAYAVGAGGSGGTTGNAGTAGSATTIAGIGGGGGYGGLYGGVSGGGSPSLTTGGDLNTRGAVGSIYLNSPSAGGIGGASIFGGNSKNGGPGVAGILGAGGNGAGGAETQGGNGGAGYIEIWEFK